MNTRRYKQAKVKYAAGRLPFDEGLKFFEAFFYFRCIDAGADQADIKIFYGYPESPNEMLRLPFWPPSGCDCQSKVGCLKIFFTLQSVIPL